VKKQANKLLTTKITTTLGLWIPCSNHWATEPFEIITIILSYSTKAKYSTDL